ncbi:hypothetical protein CK203_080726 [Vitis vinifera]|uniref:Retrovirus-related Pol polyprotein from transposon TNT 1-94 n=1 Tax=Vitis vinifera TaxID=29760 RepID=A0A438DZ58_VITVI|nr:hypothetical protein CK203_080726 [Vitis vinifera]
MNKLVTTLLMSGLPWVEIERQIQPLGNNPILNQIMAHDEEETKAPRTLSYIHVVVSKPIFTRIMACETPKEAWDKFKEMLMEVVNKIWLLGEDLTYQRVVEKVLVSLLERFESKISSLEDSKDLTKISLVELVHAFQA